MLFNLSLAVRRSSRASPFLFLAPDIAARLLGKTTYSRRVMCSSSLGFVSRVYICKVSGIYIYIYIDIDIAPGLLEPLGESPGS